MAAERTGARTMELNNLLSSMASEGTVDSSGVFTMDFAYAERKLDDYRLPDPALFILNLVASAVLSGAHEFVVETERAETRVFFNGTLPDPERLPELFTFLLKPAPHPALRELALALHGARSLPNDPKISLLVGTRTGGWQAQVTGSRLDVQPAPTERLGIKVTVQHSSSSPWARLLGFGQAGAGQKILEQLFHFCRYAPLDLRVNGRPKGSAVPMGLHQNEGPFARLFARGSQSLRISRPGSRRQDVFFAPDRASPVASSILVGLALPEVAEREGLLFISRGVAFRRPARLLGNSLACAVVSADHLEKNLSQTDLVENEEFQDLVAAVRRQVEALLEEVCVNPPLWSAEQAQALQQLFQNRYPPDQRPPAVEMFFRMQQLNQNFATPVHAQEQVDFYLALSAQERTAATTFREQMQTMLKTRVLQSVDHKRWAPAHLFLEQMGRVGKPARVEFRMLICFFAEDLEAARLLDQADSQEPSPTRLLLRYIWGWSDKPPSQSALSRFFEMERAFHDGQDARAESLAAQLEQATLTPFLGLWLGWYALHRQDYRAAEQLWFQVLARVSPALYKLWYPRMWRQLSGKIPLAAQIRWQARQGIRRYLTSGKERDRIEHNEDQGILDWTQTVWLLRSDNNPEAHRVFLRYLLRYLLVPEKFSVEPFSSPELPVALPTS
ncbi:MAG: hypothetical protein KF760_29660 [Candidatus Eremiobacteraeota bacterium]|nr:hypothetical protein [Candidatus Eremiobacteraeota bacterium]MCW5872587.1 hypothetical protein [Candidatus Eremiobacteraeota bacterium]